MVAEGAVAGRKAWAAVVGVHVGRLNGPLSDVVVDVWVGEKLYVHRTIAIPPPVGGAVEPVTLKLNFGKIPDGEHALTIALTSAPVLPRFARQLQRTKILVRQASPAAGPDYAPTVVTG